MLRKMKKTTKLTNLFVGTALTIANLSGSTAYADEANNASICRVSTHDQCIDPDTVSSFGSLQYIVIDNITGRTLLEQNADEMRQPASTTKLMTAYVALRTMQINEGSSCDVNQDTQVFMPSLISELRSDTYHLGKRGRGFISARFNEDGEATRGVYSLDELMLALGLRSDGRASEAIAVNTYDCDMRPILSEVFNTDDRNELDHHVREVFIRSMNDTARELGMDHTHFENPTGMPTENVFSTPRDIAILTSRIAQDFPEEFERYFGQSAARLPSLERRITSTSGLVRNDPAHHTGKTGTTNLAGSSYAGTYVNDSYNMTVVLFGASSGIQRDSAIRRIIRQAQPISRQVQQEVPRLPFNVPRPVPRPDHFDQTVTASTSARTPQNN
jgi:D-alanyl-D-alanine carboxypeptidase